MKLEVPRANTHFHASETRLLSFDHSLREGIKLSPSTEDCTEPRAYSLVAIPTDHVQSFLIDLDVQEPYTLGVQDSILEASIEDIISSDHSEVFHIEHREEVLLTFTEEFIHKKLD